MGQTTKYSLGEKVYYLTQDPLDIKTSEVIRINIDPKRTRYNLADGQEINEGSLYRTKSELKKAAKQMAKDYQEAITIKIDALEN